GAARGPFGNTAAALRQPALNPESAAVRRTQSIYRSFTIQATACGFDAGDFRCKLQVIRKLLLAILPAAEICKGGKVLPSAQIQSAGETNRSRWDQARVRLLIPVGVIVVVAILCIAVGVLSSAERANRISTDSEQQSILRSIDENAGRALRHLQSVASMPIAVTRIRDSYDAAWVDRRVGQWLEIFYNSDIVAVFGPDDQTRYFRSRAPDEPPPTDLAAQLA